MLKANTDIREALKASKIPIWACAFQLGVHENTLLRRLRHELPEVEKQQILSIIHDLSETNN